MRLLLSTLPVFILLVSALSFDLGQRLNARLSEVGQSAWDGYALLRVTPEKPTCDPASFVVPASVAPSAAAEDDLLAGLDGEGGADQAKDTISPEAVLAAKRKCEEQHATYTSATARITGGLQTFAGFHDLVERVVVFGNDVFSGLLVTLLLICAATASSLRMHIGLRSAANRAEHRMSEGVQLATALLLLYSVYAQWRIDQGAGSMQTNSAMFYIWMAGFAAMALAHVRNLVMVPADLPTEGGLRWTSSAAVPLYAFMTLISGSYFLLAENHAAGLAIYTQLLASHPLLYIPVGLYVWIGMLMKQTRLAPMTFDLVRPWRLSPELLAFVVVTFAAVPTAYSGASGIFVMAVGALIYQELRRAGARRQLALAATAMSGSLGVVLRPCLLVVIVASLNKQVTTDELYGWGLWVYLGTALLFFGATLLLRRGATRMEIAPISEGLAGMRDAFRRLFPYVAITAIVLLVYGFGLGTVVDEHTAPQVLPVVMLALLIYDRWAVRRAEGTANEPAFGRAALEASAETSGHIGALLIMMACSVAVGGIIERSEIMHLVPETFGSAFGAMAIIVGILVIVGMTMDPYGAVILVSASFATVAYRNGIHPAHFWMVVLVAFELGYLTPPVALNQLLARSVVGEAEWSEARKEGTSFFTRNESVIVPCAIMAVALLIVAFVPLAFY
ncbi:MAG: TRAP transporter large permease subunit [Bradymonadia bacterium]